MVTDSGRMYNTRTLSDPPTHPPHQTPDTTLTQALLAQLDKEIARQGSLLLAAQSDAFGSDTEDDTTIGTYDGATRPQSVIKMALQPLPSTEDSHSGGGGHNQAVARHFMLAQQARLAAQLEVRNAEAAAYVEHRCVFLCLFWSGICVYAMERKGCGRSGMGRVDRSTPHHRTTHFNIQRQGQGPQGAGAHAAPGLLHRGAHAAGGRVFHLLGGAGCAVRDLYMCM